MLMILHQQDALFRSCCKTYLQGGKLQLEKEIQKLLIFRLVSFSLFILNLTQRIFIMFQSVTFSSFCDSFHNLDRQDQFTYAGKRVLFDYLEEYEAATGDSVELDVIALCCEYVESTHAEVMRDYSLDSDTTEEQVLEWLQDNTSVCGETKEGTIVFAQF